MSDQFPVYLKVENDLQGISAFERAMENATSKSKRAFERNMAEIGKVIEAGLGRGVSAAGRLDLNVGQFRQAAAEAAIYRDALSATLRTSQALAKETGDTSEATRLYMQALSAQRIEAERSLSAANEQVATYTRLQAAMDATSSNVSRLREAYRGLYAEQANTIAQQVNLERNSFGALQDRALAEQAQRAKGTAARSASVFENMGYAPKTDGRGGVERLVQGAASIDRAALSGATLEQVLGRISNRAANVAQEIQRIGDAATASAAEQARAAEEAAAADARAAAAKAQYAQAADRLRAELDPMFGAQQRFNAALDQADLLYKEGAITLREYDAAIIHARQSLQAHAQTVAGAAVAEEKLQQARKKGTTADQSVINSVRSQRQAYLQLGQQLQDVAIQAQLGTNPLVILTQQGSQAAFALSGLEGKAGSVARFLAGPWGAALFLGITALGMLTKGLWDSAEASDEASKASDSFANGLLNVSQFADQATGRMKVLTDATLRAAVAMQQLQIAKANERIVTLGKEGFDLAKATGTSSRFVRERSGFANDYSPAVNEAIIKSGSSLVMLEKNLQAAASAGDAQAKTIADKVSILTAEAQSLQQSKVDARSAIDFLTGKTKILPGFSSKGGGSARSAGVGGSGGSSSSALSSKADQLAEFGADAGDKIARITDQFNDTPQAIARSDQALRQLNDLLDDIRAKNPLNAAELIKAGEAAKLAINEGYVQPFNDYMKSAREAEAIDALRAQGREDEAAALSDILRLQEAMGPLSEQQKNDVLATVIAERQRAAVIRDTQAVMNEYAQSIQNVRAALEDTVNNALRGRLSLKGIINSIGNSYLNLVSKSLVENMFGGALRSLEDQVNGSDVVKRSSEELSTSFYTASDAVLNFARSASRITDYVDGIPNPAAKGLKDPGSLVFADGSPRFPGGDEIVVTAPSDKPNVARAMMTPEKFVTGAIEKLFGALNIRLPKVFGDSLGKAMQGAAYGQIGGGLVTALGGRSSGVGAGIGGAVGEAVFKKLAPKLFSKLGDFAGPLGSIAGGLIGGALGGLFGKTPKGVATIGGTGGNLKVASITGNSSKMKAAAGSSADSAITTLEGIADQLGGTLNASRGSVSIGVRKGQYFVDPTGRGAVKEKKGAIAFGEDAAAAVKAATLDLIKDGVIEGLRAGTQRLLQQGKDLEAAVAKAAKFESVFTRLKQYTDPVGAALDAVDKEFTSLKKLFEEAGASAAEYADLEKLYQKERAKAVEEASAQMTSALKGLLDELKTGDNGRSLRDRLSAALEAYNPLASDLSAGKQVDYDKFAEAARTVIDLERQINGSQTGYFNRLDEVTNLTAKALADQQNVISIASGRPSVISSTAAEPTYEPIVGAIGALNQATIAQLIAMNQNLGTLIAQGGGGSNSSYGLSTALKLF